MWGVVRIKIWWEIHFYVCGDNRSGPSRSPNGFTHKSKMSSKEFIWSLDFLNFDIIEYFWLNFHIEKVIRSSLWAHSWRYLELSKVSLYSRSQVAHISHTDPTLTLKLKLTFNLDSIFTLEIFLNWKNLDKWMISWILNFGSWILSTGYIKF